MKHGDRIEIKVLLGAGGKPKLNFRAEIDGPVPEPVIDLGERYGSSIVITVKQLSGRSAKIEYDLRWRHIEGG